MAYHILAGDRDQVCRCSPDWQEEGGRGLWLIEQLAHAWGVNRHPDGGKVVWCVLDLSGPQPFDR